ncbi:cyclase family protein [Litoribacter ruber]|uniref:cyclase family protein n=1 Tax=Litoribacter ruber TaxID=702568 RepID=UPI001BDACC8B|nr:cyclase family protein [Litoribacter ruber]MBT0811586.1 cyclase family protein [Litoribacter ruber]
MRQWSYLFILFLFSCMQNQQESLTSLTFPEEGKWVDLSHDFSSETLYWPAEPEGFRIDTVAEGMTDGGYYYSAFSFCAPEHGGTHLDAPIHFAEGRKSVDELDLEDLTGPAVVVDVSEKALADRDYLVTQADIQDWEKVHGIMPENIILLIKTGFGQFYPDAEKYMGTEKKGEEGVANLHFPGLDGEAAAWLVKERKIKAVGIDTPSIDYGQSKDFLAHRKLMEENIPAFENVAKLDQLPTKGIYVVALPMKIKGGSGAPLRIIARVPVD